jgi:hypothetical protein
VDKAAARVNAQPGKAGFDAAMIAALAGEDVLAADEAPVNLLGGTVSAPEPQEKGKADPQEGQEARGVRDARADHPDPATSR